MVDSTRESSTWLLKANVTVLRHADRTPKQKLKFNFPIGEVWTQPFVRLLNNETEEIILREREQLTHIATAIEEAKSLGAVGEDLAKLMQLNSALFSKIEFPGTKAQLKPVYSKKQAGVERKLTKLTLVFKWGGEVCYYRIQNYDNNSPIETVHSLSTISISGSGGKLQEGYIYHEYVPELQFIRLFFTSFADKEVLKNVKVSWEISTRRS